ncbi:hypothetical protein ACWGCW_13995 [Streptomyces sp. NPDC054933]
MAFTLLAGLTATATGSAHASTQPILISKTNIYTVKNGDRRVGTLTQTYYPDTRTAQATWWPNVWDAGATTTEPVAIWLENGPHTHTLTSATAPTEIDAFSTPSYPIDKLAYPKTIDAAIHIKYGYIYTTWYGEIESQECDLWVAAPSHDYSTGANHGGQTSAKC